MKGTKKKTMIKAREESGNVGRNAKRRDQMSKKGQTQGDGVRGEENSVGLLTKGGGGKITSKEPVASLMIVRRGKFWLRNNRNEKEKKGSKVMRKGRWIT